MVALVFPGGLPGMAAMIPGGLPLALPTTHVVVPPPAAAPPAPTIPAGFPPALPSTEADVPPPAVVPLPPPVCAKLLKLNPIKDAKAFLDSLEQIQFYPRMPEFLTDHADESLTTDLGNLEAS